MKFSNRRGKEMTLDERIAELEVENAACHSRIKGLEGLNDIHVILHIEIQKRLAILEGIEEHHEPVLTEIIENHRSLQKTYNNHIFSLHGGLRAENNDSIGIAE